MAISIIANTSASYAQSGLRTRNDAVLASTQRLSSGLRVFSAKEDAAATAVGTSLKIENASLKTAILNASAGSSALQIADGGMSQVADILTRMISLATQCSSGHLDDVTRSLADTEFQNLKSEVDRISGNLAFGGVNLLAGSRNFTVGTASDSIGGGVTNVHFDPALVTGDSTFRYSYDATTEVMTMTRIDGGASTSQSIDLTSLLNGVAGVGRDMSGTEKVDVGFTSLGISITLDSRFARGASVQQGSALTTGADITMGAVDVAHPAPYFTPAVTGVASTTVAGLTALVSGYSTSTGALTLPLNTNGTTVTLGSVAGISYSVNGGARGASGAASADLVGAGPNTVDIYVDVAGGGTQKVGTWTTGAVSTAGTTAGSVSLDVGKGLIAGTYVDNFADTRLEYKIGSGITSGEDLLVVSVPATTGGALGISSLQVTSEMNATSAMDTLQAALTKLNQGRAAVGAQQLRLEQVGRNLSTQVENNESARSALLDVDVAKEITDLTSNEAMMQAASTMLARANQMPNMLVDLLKNS